MRGIAVCIMLCLMLTCSACAVVRIVTQQEQPESLVTVVNQPNVDRSDMSTVALAFITAYHEQDIGTLSELKDPTASWDPGQVFGSQTRTIKVVERPRLEQGSVRDGSLYKGTTDCDLLAMITHVTPGVSDPHPIWYRYIVTLRQDDSGKWSVFGWGGMPVGYEDPTLLPAYLQPWKRAGALITFSREIDKDRWLAKRLSNTPPLPPTNFSLYNEWDEMWPTIDLGDTAQEVIVVLAMGNEEKARLQDRIIAGVKESQKWTFRGEYGGIDPDGRAIVTVKDLNAQHFMMVPLE